MSSPARALARSMDWTTCDSGVNDIETFQIWTRKHASRRIVYFESRANGLELLRYICGFFPTELSGPIFMRVVECERRYLLLQRRYIRAGDRVST